jgi:hypothetical protein
MPVTYSIDALGKMIRTTCSGPVKLEEVLEHFRTLQDDPACTGQLDVLLNVSETQALPQASQLSAVSGAVGMIREKVQFEFCAIVASGDAMFGMMRMFEVYADKYFRAVRVFRESAKAESWLAAQRAAQDSAPKPHPRDT